MAHKADPLKGLNPDQSGPLEKIQNGDPKAGPNRDQRSGAAESGGPGPSLQKGPTGTENGQVDPHDGLEKTMGQSATLKPAGVEGDPLPAGHFDRAGHASYEKGKLKDHTDKAGGTEEVQVGDIKSSKGTKASDAEKERAEKEKAEAEAAKNKGTQKTS